MTDINKTILSEQQAQADSLAAIEKTMLTVGASLTTAQKSYFTALINEEVKTKDVDTIIQRSFSLKFAALGLIAGAFLVIMWICLRYVLAQTIKTKDEISELYAKYRILMSKLTPEPIKGFFEWYRERTIMGNPSMASEKFKNSLEEIKEKVSSIRKK